MNNVISTEISVYRNLKDYKFVPKLSAEKKGEIIDKLLSVLKGKFDYINLKTADEKTLDELKNANINFSSQHIFVDKAKRTYITLFDGEHLTIKLNSIGFDKTVYKQIENILKIINDKINLAYSDEYGYLMSDITKIGTGLFISSVVCLPNLKNIEKIEQVKQNMRKLRYKLDEKGGDSYTLSTICNLGFTEREILSEFEKMLYKLEELEVESAKLLFAENHDEIIDQVNRCLAIMNSSYLMSIRELHGHISTLRTAKSLNLVNISNDKINQLQALVNDTNEDFITKDELKTLAEKTKEIIKGV